MPNRHYPPAYLRYLKARLWNLGHPSFWATAIFLSVVGLAIQEYWLNPDFLTQKPAKEVTAENSNDSSLSPEDEAIAADIDNLPVLLKDSDQENLAVIANTPTDNSQNKNSKSLFPDVTSSATSAANDAKSNPALGLLDDVAAPKEQNPFVLQADNLLQIGTNYGINQLSGGKSSTPSVEQSGTVTTSSVQGIGLSTQTENSQNAAISPLQAAINQSTTQKLPNFNRPTDSQTNIMGNAAYGGAIATPPTKSLPNPTSLNGNELNPATSYNQPTVTNLPDNFYTNFNNNQVSPSVAPPVNYATPNNTTPYSLQTPNQSVVMPTNPTAYPNYGNSTLPEPTQIPQSNVSSPRPNAGLYGGVEINGHKYP
jgi:hypothetical protein